MPTKTATRLSLPEKAKPVKILPKSVPTNGTDATVQGGALHVDPKHKVYELHAFDQTRAVVIQLDAEETPLAKDATHELKSGSIPAPAVKLMQKGATIEDAKPKTIELWDSSDDADVTFSRDQQLIDVPQNARAMIPVFDGDIEPTEVCIDAKKLKEVAEAFGCDKLIIGLAVVNGVAEPMLHVRPIKGNHVGAIRQAERPISEAAAGDEPEATEPLIED